MNILYSVNAWVRSREATLLFEKANRWTGVIEFLRRTNIFRLFSCSTRYTDHLSVKTFLRFSIFRTDTHDVHMIKIKVIDDLERIASFTLKIARSVSIRVYNYSHIVIRGFFPKRDPWVEWKWVIRAFGGLFPCLLYTSDAADE